MSIRGAKPRCKQCIHKNLAGNEGSCRVCGEIQVKEYGYTSQFVPENKPKEEE